MNQKYRYLILDETMLEGILYERGSTLISFDNSYMQSLIIEGKIKVIGTTF